MHDRTIEDRLRSTLRDEADALPMTLTTHELERRLALRRRVRLERRFGILAAGIAAIAIAGVFSLAIGPFRRVDVANPSVASIPPSLAPSVVPPSPSLPPPSPESTSRVNDPLGRVDEAILVRAVGDDAQRPTSFEVSVFDPATNTSRVIATLPGTILPEDGWLDGGEKPPVVSRGGYLAMEFTRGPNEDDRYPAITIVDLFAPTAQPWLLDRYRDPRWGPTEQLAVEATGSGETRVATIVPPSLDPSTTELGVVVGQWSSDPGARFLATKDGAWGYLGSAGTFTGATDLPAVYQRTGRERPAGVDLHTLGMACDSGPTGDACILGEWSTPDEPPVRSWYAESEAVRLADHAWAADGRGVLLLLTTGLVGDRITIDLAYASTPDERTTVGRLDVPEWVLPAILGISSEPDPGQPTITVIGDSDGRVVAFLLEGGIVVPVEGVAWFAGWADDPQPYDPD